MIFKEDAFRVVEECPGATIVDYYCRRCKPDYDRMDVLGNKFKMTKVK
ncbi:MAG: hypothetical protein ACTSSH_05995 [Candidatus Heimdallarchaeota archaeon]